MIEDLKDPWSNCYIGVTNDLCRRWAYHSKSIYTVGNFIRSKQLTKDQNMIIIASGSEEECFELEASLRPLPFIGLNEASGGRGGDTGSYTTERNQTISSKLKGRKIEWAEKISKTRKIKAVAVGKGNPNAKVWRLLKPCGTEVLVEGSFSDFCSQQNIMGNVMIKYMGTAVPPPSFGGYGGFRPKSTEHELRRQNTTGWLLVSKE